MKKLTTVLVLSMVLAGCSWFSSTSTETPAPTPTTQPPAQSKLPPVTDSGINGTAMMGPTCPVERMPPDPNCADKPYTGQLSVATSTGITVKTVQVESDGSFSTTLAAGEYVISLGGDMRLPSMSPINVVVKEGQFTKVALQLDSGIR